MFLILRISPHGILTYLWTQFIVNALDFILKAENNVVFLKR